MMERRRNAENELWNAANNNSFVLYSLGSVGPRADKNASKLLPMNQLQEQEANDWLRVQQMEVKG